MDDASQSLRWMAVRVWILIAVCGLCLIAIGAALVAIVLANANTPMATAGTVTIAFLLLQVGGALLAVGLAVAAVRAPRPPPADWLRAAAMLAVMSVAEAIALVSMQFPGHFVWLVVGTHVAAMACLIGLAFRVPGGAGRRQQTLAIVSATLLALAMIFALLLQAGVFDWGSAKAARVVVSWLTAAANGTLAFTLHRTGRLLAGLIGPPARFAHAIDQSGYNDDSPGIVVVADDDP